MAAYKVKVRRTGATERERFESLADALAALRARLDDLAPAARRGPQRALTREIEPVQQVALRGEIAGPGVRGGVDVRGDGSAEAFTGRWRRVLVTREPGESAYDALARALGGS
jgi:anti-sigma factor RsiW